jgi:hypothetical protein
MKRIGRYRLSVFILNTEHRSFGGYIRTRCLLEAGYLVSHDDFPFEVKQRPISKGASHYGAAVEENQSKFKALSGLAI